MAKGKLGRTSLAMSTIDQVFQTLSQTTSCGKREKKNKRRSVAVLLKLPVAIVERTHLTRLEPTTDAVKVKGVIADAPGDGALLVGGRLLIRLALDAQIHNVIAANGAIVDDNVPRPECDGAPLFQLELLLRFR